MLLHVVTWVDTEASKGGMLTHIIPVPLKGKASMNSTSNYEIIERKGEDWENSKVPAQCAGILHYRI